MLVLQRSYVPDVQFRKTWRVHPSNRPYQVVVINSVYAHDEVTASYLGAFGQVPNCHVQAFLHRKRFNIDKIYDQLPGKGYREIRNITELEWKEVQQEIRPDIVLLITPEADVLDSRVTHFLDQMFNESNIPLFASLHDAKMWQEKKRSVRLAPWVKAKRLNLLTLSPHVKDFMQKVAEKEWLKQDYFKGAEAAIRETYMDTFVPVFNISIAGRNSYDMEDGPDQNANKSIHIVTQGELVRQQRTGHRRYKETINRFNKLVEQKGRNTMLMKLDIVGAGEVPHEQENTQVVFHANLPYDEFYSVLHSGTAMLPNLGFKKYFEYVATSTFPACLIAGVPPIADKKVLETYRYLSMEDVYFQEKGESEVDVVARIRNMSEEERRRKTDIVMRKNQKMTAELGQMAESWLKRARHG